MGRFLLLLALCGVAHADKRRTVVTTTSIEIYGPIRFARTSANLDQGKSTRQVIEAYASMLKGNTSITLVEIRAYGADATRSKQQLADARARVIVDALITRGVESKRLVARGYAKPRPGESADPGFYVLARDTSSSAPSCGGGLLDPHR